MSRVFVFAAISALSLALAIYAEERWLVIGAAFYAGGLFSAFGRRVADHIGFDWRS